MIYEEVQAPQGVIESLFFLEFFWSYLARFSMQLAHSGGATTTYSVKLKIFVALVCCW
jgi:hypothetical protein